VNVWSIPTTVFPGRLYIRGMFDKRPNKLEELQDLGIDTVICMLRKRDPDLENLSWLLYQNYPLPDTDTVKETALWSAANTAASRIKEGRGVLIHCIAARDRAPTTAALTLTILEGISGSEAMYRVKSKKPTTFHNRAFVAYLNKIEPKC